MDNYSDRSHSDVLYFAYGSNLNLAALRSILGAHGLSEDAVVPLCPAYLPDMKLIFNYYSTSRRGSTLNVVPELGSLVPGYLFRLTTEAWTVLDEKEGHPHCYNRVSVITLGEGGEYIPAITYAVPQERTSNFEEPTSEYLTLCLAGRKHLKIDTRALLAAGRNAHYPKLNALFCYGTLMRGESHFPIIARSRVKVALLAQASGRLLNCGDFPGLVPQPCHYVEGEFFRFQDIGQVLAELDQIEGFRSFGTSDNLFCRTILDIHVGDGRVRKAWAYVLADGDYPELGCQDWRAYHNRADPALLQILSLHSSQKSNFFERLASLINRFSVPGELENRPLDAANVLETLRTGDVSERKMAQASGVWMAGFGKRAWRSDER